MSRVDIFTDHFAISTVFELWRGINIPAQRVSSNSKKMHIYIIYMSIQEKKIEHTFLRLVRDNEIEDRYDKIVYFFLIFRINFNVEQNEMI